MGNHKCCNSYLHEDFTTFFFENTKIIVLPKSPSPKKMIEKMFSLEPKLDFSGTSKLQQRTKNGKNRAKNNLYSFTTCILKDQKSCFSDFRLSLRLTCLKSEYVCDDRKNAFNLVYFTS